MDKSVIFSPILVWVIKVDGLNILVDAGTYSPDNASYNNHTNYEGTFYITLSSLSQIFDLVIISHLHWDHASGLKYLSESRVLVQQSELDFSLSPSETQKRYYDYNSSNSYINGASLELIRGDYNLTEHAQIVHLPGHTPGSQGLLLEQSESSILIAGDAVPLFDNWYSSKKRINGIFYNKDLFIETYEKIGSFDTQVLPSHDSFLLSFFENDEMGEISKKIKNYFSKNKGVI